MFVPAEGINPRFLARHGEGLGGMVRKKAFPDVLDLLRFLSVGACAPPKGVWSFASGHAGGGDAFGTLRLRIAKKAKKRKKNAIMQNEKFARSLHCWLQMFPLVGKSPAKNMKK